MAESSSNSDENNGDLIYLREGWPLFIWRFFSLSIIAIIITFVFEFNLALKISITCTGSAIFVTGWGFILQDRADFTRRDNIQNNIFGGTCILFSAAMIVFTWIL